MLGNTLVTLKVEITIPLTLANKLEAEADRLQTSIPDMLSAHLISAERDRDEKEFEEEAMRRVNGDTLTFDNERQQAWNVQQELNALETPAATPPGGVEEPMSPPSQRSL